MASQEVYLEGHDSHRPSKEGCGETRCLAMELRGMCVCCRYQPALESFQIVILKQQHNVRKLGSRWHTIEILLIVFKESLNKLMHWDREYR